MRRKTSQALVPLVVCTLVALCGPAAAQSPSKISPLAAARAALVTGRSRIVVRAPDPDSRAAVAALIAQAGGSDVKALPLIDGFAAELPNETLLALANSDAVAHLAIDRPIIVLNERTGVTIGAAQIRQELGYDGTGVGVAVIDSGITSWHDDLTGGGVAQRVDHFVDFVGGLSAPYDDYGHGTHVAGIIAGNGFDSGGARTGVAPGARLIVLKVLDGTGRGYISSVIAALDYLVAHKDEFNIRVANLSVGAGVYQSYMLDPLTLAAQRAVDAGIVVVAAGGNFGRGSTGKPQYLGITAPGNAPWVLTVGASSHMGTTDRADDTMGGFSSRGPTAVDYTAKPDLAAPGVGIESLSDPASAFYTTQAPYLLPGTVETSYLPYLSQSGTSMAAPVVAGTVALMLQANPSLTPDQVKRMLQYTAQPYAEYDRLTQGTGFLNARGAVELARFAAAPWMGPPSDTSNWGGRILEGNYLVACADLLCTGTLADTRQNVVWGMTCGGLDCSGPWSLAAAGDAVATSDGDTVVWGNSDEGDTVVWGNTAADQVVWGPACPDSSCEPSL